MDNRSEVREFLTSRRAKITPQQAGLPAYSANRRVKGLRREEVAMLAGVSAEYYARLERGNLSGVSETVLDSLARALQLDDAERAHLNDLARTANTTRRTPRRRTSQTIRPSLQHLLDAMTEAPAFIRNGRLDILATNRLGRALYDPVFADPTRPANLARFQFLSPIAADYMPELDDQVAKSVALLRTEAGRDPYNRDLTDLIGELSTRSEEFRALWAAHDVRLHQTGVKLFCHPAVGELTLSFEAMPIPTDPGLTLTALCAEPGTPSHDGLKLLASWAATLDQDDAAPTGSEHSA
ncbi:helix-turn-helix transcriptional regulator [Streptomyces sp. NPDC094038]|uniref:helix-turn-helix transcriptional regulator n=1 Tax=Streptomyces sp. NPDC094038 TaxID=3366055 RepID=UPI0037F7F403